MCAGRIQEEVERISSAVGLPRGSVVKKKPAKEETWLHSLGPEDPQEKEMATHSSVLAWETPWTEEPGGLQSMGHKRVRHDLATKQQQRLCSLGCWMLVLQT